MENLTVLLVVCLLCCCVPLCTGSTSILKDSSTCEVNTLYDFGAHCEEYGKHSNNSFAVPEGRNRVCIVEHDVNDGCIRLNSHTGSVEDLRYKGYPRYVPACVAIVGMNLTFFCNLNGSTVYKDGESLGRDLQLVNFPSISSGDAGLYECRGPGDEVAAAYNLSITGNVHIGVASDIGVSDNFELKEIQKYRCCENSNIWNVDDTNVRSFYVYGEEPNVTIEQVIWQTEHCPTDLEITLTKDEHNPLLWNVSIGVFPVTFDTTPRISIILSATNNFSSHTMCIHAEFSGNHRPLSPNDTLPENKTAAVGENVMFECVIGIEEPDDNSIITVIGLEFIPPPQSNSSKSLTTRCQWTDCGNPNEKSLAVDVTTLLKTESYQSVRFAVQVHNVSEELSGSTFSCSIIFDSSLQWCKEAQLTVVPHRNNIISTMSIPQEEEPVKDNNLQYIAAVCVVMAVVVAAIVIVIPIAVMWKKRKRLYGLSLDQVPLTDQSSIHSSQSTICSESAGTPVPHRNGRLPCIEISSVNGVRHDLVVREPRPRKQQQRAHTSMDSGVEDTLSVDNLSLEGTRRPPSTLQLQLYPRFHPLVELSPVRLCKSESDLSPSLGPSSDQPRGSSMLHLSHKKCVVYISYTDRMADWVKNCLKPHIESWKTAEVMLHESDMIPGLTISGERHRLILEADKIIIVVSRDYSDSPWCSYELVHAIHKEPALCRGKIIPILVDDCRLLPSIIGGLVPLPVGDSDFDSRLWSAIHQSPRVA